MTKLLDLMSQSNNIELLSSYFEEATYSIIQTQIQNALIANALALTGDIETVTTFRKQFEKIESIKSLSSILTLEVLDYQKEKNNA